MNDLFRFISIVTICFAVMVILVVMWFASTCSACNMAGIFVLGWAGIRGFAAVDSARCLAQAGHPVTAWARPVAPVVKARHLGRGVSPG